MQEAMTNKLIRLKHAMLSLVCHLSTLMIDPVSWILIISTKNKKLNDKSNLPKICITKFSLSFLHRRATGYIKSIQYVHDAQSKKNLRYYAKYVNVEFKYNYMS